MTSILPQSDEALSSYHQKLSWKISEEQWRSKELFLQLEKKIPGSSGRSPKNQGWADPYPGGCVLVGKTIVEFLTMWPKDTDLERISLDAFFTIKIDDGNSVSFKCDKVRSFETNHINAITTRKMIKLDHELLYDADRCFTIEAELKVTKISGEEKSELNIFVKDLQSIFGDVKNSDVVIIAGKEKFYCHKNILSARCEVFKNMLSPNTLESESSTIEVKEVSPEAIESMLKFIYTGEVPEDPEKLTLDLLNIAEMYLLGHLKESCLRSLVEKLEVSSCITTFIMADRYVPSHSSGNLRELVIKFMKCKAEEVVETDNWDKLMDNHPSLAKEVVRAIVKGGKEKHKCQFCVVLYD